MNDITIRDVFDILRKWLALVIIVPVLVAAVVGIYYYGYTDDEYTAKASLYVLIRYEDTTGNMRVDTTTSNFFASDYKELFKRSPVIDQTEQRLGIDNLERLVTMDVTSIANTRIVEVSATSKNRTLCASAVNTASEVFKEYIEAFMKVESVSITQTAEVPTGPSGPARMRNTALAYIVALMVCCGAVLAAEMLNTRITSDKQIQEHLNQPLLGTVPDYRKDMAFFLEKEKPSVSSLYRYVSQPTRESVKMVTTNIGFSSVDRPVRSLAVTSSTPSEGKSSLSVLLASAFAEEGKLTLLVDMDFRKPSLGRIVKRRNRQDLMDYLAGRASLDDIITPTAMKNVFFIDSSHSAAMVSRVVQSDSFDQFLTTVKQMFGMVIFDSPPLAMFIDAAVLASKLDGAVMIIATNQVDMRLAEEVLEQLKRSGANTLGVVLNFLPQTKGRGYYSQKYGGYYYGYGYGYGAQRSPRRAAGAKESREADVV